MLSLMPITRERLAHHPKRQTRRRRGPRAHQRPAPQVRDLDGKYAGRGRLSLPLEGKVAERSEVG